MVLNITDSCHSKSYDQLKWKRDQYGNVNYTEQQKSVTDNTECQLISTGRPIATTLATIFCTINKTT